MNKITVATTLVVTHLLWTGFITVAPADAHFYCSIGYEEVLDPACALDVCSVFPSLCPGCPYYSCAPCEPQAGDGHSCFDCPAGSSPYTSVGSTATYYGLCTDCPAGTYSTGGVSVCQLCPAGYEPSPDQGSCVPCQPGYYRSDWYGQPFEYGYCFPCPKGTYQPSYGKINCIDCSAGYYQPSQGQTQCLACLEGTYQPSTGSTTNCIECGPGTYQDQQGQSSCDACSECTTGEYANPTCTSTTDATCFACTPIDNCGHIPFCTGPNDSQCAACLDDYWVINGTQDQCVYCEASTSCNGNGFCVSGALCACAQGFTGASCDQCATGYFGYPTCTGCSTTCPAGTGTNVGNGSQCTTEADRVCDTCAPGDGNDGTSLTCATVIAVCPTTLETAGCYDAPQAKFQFSEKRAGKEKMKAQWKGLGAASYETGFGDPLLGTASVALCVYDDAGVLTAEMLVDRADDTCSGKPCWRAAGERAYKYKDKDSLSDGVSNLSFPQYVDERGRAKADAKGKNDSAKSQVFLPTGVVAALTGKPSATIQMRTSYGLCASATVVPSIDDGVRYKAEKN